MPQEGKCSDNPVANFCSPLDGGGWHLAQRNLLRKTGPQQEAALPMASSG